MKINVFKYLFVIGLVLLSLHACGVVELAHPDGMGILTFVYLFCTLFYQTYLDELEK